MKSKFIFILIALFFVLPFVLSLDANGVTSVPCDIKVFLADKCADLNGADLKVVYQNYTTYCFDKNSVPVVIDAFGQVAIGCLDPTGVNDPKNGQTQKVCNPDEYLRQCCTRDASGVVPFGDLFMGYSKFCESISNGPIAANEFITFLTKTGYLIKGETRENTVVNGLSYFNDRNSQVLEKSPGLGFNISDLFSPTNLLIIIVIVILLLIAVMIFFSFIFIKMKQNEVVKEMKQVKDKMIALERTYLKGKMDEQTYRKLMQQYQLRMTELELEIARLKKKKDKPEEAEKE